MLRSRSTTNTVLTNVLSPQNRIWYLLLKVSMSVLMATGVAILASFMYNFPIMQKVELKSLENALNKNLYCQQAAIDGESARRHCYSKSIVFLYSFLSVIL